MGRFNTTGLGAIHGAELESVFGTHNFSKSAQQLFPYDQRLSDAIQGYWSSFALTGVPSAPGRKIWTPFDTETPEIHLDQAIEVGTVDSWRMKRCAYWKNYTARYGEKRAQRRMRYAAFLLPI